MGCILNLKSLNLYTIIIVIKIKKSSFKKKQRVKVKFNYEKKEPCIRGCSWIITFSHCLNFGYFSIRTQNGYTCSTHEEKTL